jgi:DNA-directed RNA polymerase specialized sigma24 family protein
LKGALTAQDLMHELFVKITTQHDVPDIRNRKAYLFRMAANLATDYQREAVVLRSSSLLLLCGSADEGPRMIGREKSR